MQKDYLEESPFPEPQPVGRGIGPQDIQEKEFRVAFRGYNERDVDVFLDELTEEVARLRSENESLHRQAQARGTQQFEATGALEAESVVREAEEQAERILREANERAARVASEARARAAEAEARARAAEGRAERATTSASETSFVDAFLARERAFLQSLAGLIQNHAEDVKAEFRRARESSGSAVARASETRPIQVPGEGREARGSEIGTAEARGPGGVTPGAAGAENPGPRGGGEVTQPVDHRNQEDERSIRELFWGQD